jgi:hypothetical protein
VLKVATKIVTAAQLNLLATTPVQILAGITGHYFCAVLAVIKYLAGSTPYPATGANLLIETLGDDKQQIDTILGIFPADGFLTATTNQVMRNAPTAPFDQNAVDQNAVSDISGKGLWLDTDGDLFGLGNGTLEIFLYYVDVPL